jgi:hypothetical protein
MRTGQSHEPEIRPAPGSRVREADPGDTAGFVRRTRLGAVLELSSRRWPEPPLRQGVCSMDRVARPRNRVPGVSPRPECDKGRAGLLGPLLCHYKVLHL